VQTARLKSRPRQERSADTLHRVLRATERLLSGRHFEDITIGQILRTSGVSVGSFYARFHSKDDLLPLLYQAYSDDLRQRMAGWLDPARWAGKRLEERVRDLVELTVTTYRERRGLLRTVALLARMRPGAIAKTSLRERDEQYESAAALLLDCRDQIVHPEPRRAVQVGLLFVLAACRDKILFGEAPQPASVRVSDEQLSAELAHALYAYLTTSPRGETKIMKLIPVCAIVLLLMLAPLRFGARGAQITWEDYTYKTADRQNVSGQRGRLVLPEDPTDPTGAKVTLVMMRLRSTATASSSSGEPIVFLHGGPGGSAIGAVQSPAFRTLFEALRTQGDVILLDQRGSGQSTPSLIPPNKRVFERGTLATRTTFLAFLQDESLVERERLLKLSVNPARYTILESVADLESVRESLGTKGIRLVGHSYGTQLAQAYVRQHPEGASRVVLIGPEGLDDSWKLPARADAMLRRIAELAKSSPVVGAEFTDLIAMLNRVLAKLDRAPVSVVMKDEQKRDFTLDVGADALRFIVAKFYLNDPDNFRYLPKLLDELDKGRRPWCLVYNLGQMLGSPVSLTWLTTDAATGVSAQRRALVESQEPGSLLGAALHFPFPEINDVWKMRDLGDAFRQPVSSDVPTLIVAGTLDGLTPPEQARTVLRSFSRGRLIEVENGGHVSQLRAPGLGQAVADFLAGKTDLPSRLTMPAPEFVPLIAKEKE
jgi:pimeloyl-ACP methyl ester carboxylesterase/AcrR family transcriptional regulator